MLPVPGMLPVPDGVSGAGQWGGDRHAGQAGTDLTGTDLTGGDHTAAGLPVRVPRANLLPGSVGGGHPAADATGGQAGGRRAKGPAAPQRSPELVRSRLSGFQGGIRRAKGEAPGTGEETGR
jgi:hypothetical protein